MFGKIQYKVCILNYMKKEEYKSFIQQYMDDFNRSKQ